MSRLRYIFGFLLSKTYNTAENNQFFIGKTAGSSLVSEGWTHLSKNEECVLNNFSKLPLSWTLRMQFISLLLGTYFQIGWLNTSSFSTEDGESLVQTNYVEWMPNKQSALKRRGDLPPSDSSTTSQTHSERRNQLPWWINTHMHKKKKVFHFAIFSNTEGKLTEFSPHLVPGN